MANAIMIALGKAKPKSGHMGMGESPHDEVENEEESDVELADDELEAAKMMREAKSDEDFAKALKTFVKICMENGEY